MSIRDKALAKTPKRRPQIEVASAKTPHAVAADDSRPAKSRRYPSEGTMADGNQAKESAKAQFRSPDRRCRAAKDLEQD